MHEYRRFIEAEMDKRRWKRPDLERASGLSRQTLAKILTDKRDHLGRMPDDSTLHALGDAFGSYDRVRAAAARALTRYADSGAALSLDLSDVSIDELLEEIRRRVVRSVPGQETTSTDDPQTFESVADILGSDAVEDPGVDRRDDRKHGENLG